LTTATRLITTLQILNRVRMRQVALMLAIEETRTLRAAAGHVGLTQPAATKMLHELESALGQPLFDRVGRGLQVNAAGARVMGYFRGIRGSMESLNRDLYELREGSAGKLAIGSIMAASPGRLTGALLRLKAAFPLLSLAIAVDTSDRLLKLLDEGTLDLVIGRPTGDGAVEYAFKPIEDERLAVVVSPEHPLAQKRKVEFIELMTYPWILQPDGSPMRDVIEREFREHHFKLPQGLIETGSILTTIDMVRQSRCIGVVPETVAVSEKAVLSIVAYRMKQKLETYGSLVPKDRPLSKAGEHFLDLLHGQRKSRKFQKP
jgi:DNA-binding transcriptional LysR family regulator